MKLIFLILVYTNYVICTNIENKRYHLKSYPKKVNPGMYQVINAGKYTKESKDNRNSNPTGMVDKDKNKYTAFLPIENAVTLNVPQSPLFLNQDLDLDQKPRIKKTLPDDIWSSIRNKRSVDKQLNKTKKVGRQGKKGKGTKNASRTNQGKKKLSIRKKSQRSGSKKSARVGKQTKNKVLRNVPRNATKLNNKKSIRQAKVPGVNKPVKVERRLTGARDASTETYPYVVSIQKDHEHWCSGALINQKMIATTANCFWKGNLITRMKVRVGSRFTDRGGTVHAINEIMRHPEWNIRSYPDFDIALALLQNKVKFSHSVHAVDLPNRHLVPPFDDVWVTSWGGDRRDGIVDHKTNTLQVYHGHVISREKCNNITERFGVTVTENFMCLNQDGRRAPCTRDTGAPAVSDGVLWGLASWGIRKPCGTERFPAVFTYLGSDAIMDFIANATHLLMADERFYPFPDHRPRVHFARTSTTPFTMPYK